MANHKEKKVLTHKKYIIKVCIQLTKSEKISTTPNLKTKCHLELCFPKVIHIDTLFEFATVP